MKLSIFAASLLALCPIAALAQDSKPAPAFPAAKPKKLYAKNDLRGKPAPEFHAESWLSKEPDRKGKVILIDFWATWCPPCRELIPELEAIKARFKDDLVVIGVSDEKTQTVQKFISDKNVSYAMAIDAAAKMKKEIGVEGIPHVLIIDSSGIVRWQGFPQSDEDRLTEKVISQIIDADKARQKTPGKTNQTLKEPTVQKPKGG